jgi:hypothetical protein
MSNPLHNGEPFRQLSELAHDWRDQAAKVDGIIDFMRDLGLKTIDVPTLRAMSQMYAGAARTIENHVNPVTVNEGLPF